MNFNMSLMLARLSKGSGNERKNRQAELCETENIDFWKVFMELKDNLHERKYLDTESLVTGWNPKDIQRDHVTQ